MDKFNELVEDQFQYGGKKYAHDEARESTDILFEKYGKNWLLGTIDKYTFRFGNLHRERDVLKIACYMYILWLKRGFHVMRGGINDPPIDTTVEMKAKYFPIFLERFQEHKEAMTEVVEAVIPLADVSDTLGAMSECKWSDIPEYYLFDIYYWSWLEWNNFFKETEIHDTDTNNEQRK